MFYGGEYRWYIFDQNRWIFDSQAKSEVHKRISKMKKIDKENIN